MVKLWQLHINKCMQLPAQANYHNQRALYKNILAYAKMGEFTYAGPMLAKGSVSSSFGAFSFLNLTAPSNLQKRPSGR